MKKKKGQLQISFAWIFAIFIGAVVIFLAIYTATQIVGTKQYESESFRAKQIGVLLTPVETNLEQGKFATIYVPDETIIFNNCTTPSPSNPFGSQEIRVSTKPAFSGKWQEMTGVESTFHNKYLFSSSSVSGEEEFYAFSKPFRSVAATRPTP